MIVIELGSQVDDKRYERVVVVNWDLKGVIPITRERTQENIVYSMLFTVFYKGGETDSARDNHCAE